MKHIMDLGHFLRNRDKLAPLSPEQLVSWKKGLDAELTALRKDVHATFPEGLMEADASAVNWLIERLESCSPALRRYLAHHRTWM